MRSAIQPTPSAATRSPASSSSREAPSGSVSFAPTSRNVSGIATSAPQSSTKPTRIIPAFCPTIPAMLFSSGFFEAVAARSS